MPFNRFAGQRGGIIRLRTQFKKDDVLTDPYSPGEIDIYNPSSQLIASGITYSGFIQKESTGIYYYDYQTTSGQTVGIYLDVWKDILFTEGAGAVSGINAFEIHHNDEDRADWEIQAAL